MTQPIATTASQARQRLAASLSTLQQDPNVPANVMEIVSGVAKAMGPLFQLERGSTEYSLLFTARAALQETLGKMQTVDQNYPGVGGATEAIAFALGQTFTAIRDHNIQAPGAPAPASAIATAPVAVAPPPAPVPVPAAVEPAPVPLVQPAPQPMPLVQQPPVAQPMPLVQPAAQPMPLVQPAPVAPYTPTTQGAPPSPAAPFAPAPAPAQRETTKPWTQPVAQAPVRAQEPPSGRGRATTKFPDTAAKVPVGPAGLPRLEVELDASSESNFYTGILGDIRDHGGIFVATYAALAVNSQCEVVLLFPGSYTAELQGFVRWRRDPKDDASMPGLGIEITQCPADGWRLIERYIAKREPLMHDV